MEVKPKKSLQKSRRKVCHARKTDESPPRDRATASLLHDQRRKSHTAQRLKSPLVRSKADESAPRAKAWKSPLLRMTYKSCTRIMRAQDHARERLPSLLRLIRLRSMPIETGLQVLQSLRDPCKSANAADGRKVSTYDERLTSLHRAQDWEVCK